MARKREKDATIRRTAILVLGMHRGGTSALARALNLLGAVAPRTLMPADPTNPRGFWESNKLVPIHEQMLAAMGSSWDDWLPVNPQWRESAEAPAFGARISEAISQEFADASLFVVKDPRICRLIPIWLDVLREMKVKPVACHIIRNPLEVASSLKTRNGFLPEKSLLLWLRHVLDAERESRSMPRVFLAYDRLLADWQTQLTEAGKTLGIAWPRLSAESSLEISQFLTEDLHRNRAADSDLAAHPSVGPWVKSAYGYLQKLMAKPNDASARAGLDAIAIEFERGCAAFGVVALSERRAADELSLRVTAGDERAAAIETAWRGTEQDLNRATAEMAAAQAQALRLEQAAASESARAAELETRSSVLESANAQAQLLLGSSTRRIGELEAALLKTAELEKQREQFRTEALRLDAKLIEVATQSAQFRSDLRENEFARAVLKSEAEQSLSRAASLESAMARSEATVLDLQADKRALQMRLDDLIRSHAEARADQTRALAELSAAVARADGLAGALESKQAEIRRLADNLESARASFTKSEAVAAEFEARVGRNERQLAELKTTLARAAAQVADLNSQLAAARSDVARGQSEAAAERALREDLETKANAATTRAEESAAGLALASSRIAELESRLNTWSGLTRAAMRRAVAARPKRPDAPVGRAAPGLREQAATIEKAGLFDPSWYIDRNPDVRNANVDPLIHYLEFGWKEGRDPSAHFSTAEYLQANHDVRAAAICPLYHYAIVGRLERRSPRRGALPAAKSRDVRELVAQEFDVVFYQSKYSRALKSGQAPLDHFLDVGWRRGLDPNRHFSVVDYLRNNADVRMAGINPFVHYLTAGRREGRVPRNEPHYDEEHIAQRRVIAAEFDVAFYLANNPEVANSAVDPIGHFMSEGWREGRDPSASFSSRHYLAVHPDVREAGINPFYHFLVAGRQEGRAPQLSEPEVRRREVREVIATAFDADYYLATYSDVAQAEIDPLDHYLDNGWSERRDPSPLFSTGYYLDANADVVAAGVNPFYHYLVAGKREGRSPSHPGGWRANALARLKSVDRRIEEETVVAAGLPAQPALSDFLSRLDAAVGQSNRRLVISLSHDNYLASVGGVQLCLNIEECLARDAHAVYLNLHPTLALPFLSRERNPRSLSLNVVCNGALWGQVSAAAIVSGLRSMRSRLASIDIVVHSLLGHSPEMIVDICRSLAPRHALFWVHDFFAICPSYTLLRNGISYCGAPAPDSGACSVCVFGEERKPHLKRVRDLFAAVPFDVVAPSQFAAEYWRSHSDLPHQKIVVQPHCIIEAGSAMGRASSIGGDSARVAFLGHPSPHKGWEAFVGLVDRLDSDPRYDFHHLGMGRKCFRQTTFTQVSILDGGPTAMTDALRARAVDAVVLWSIWPETFSFVAHEAIAAGALILTGPESGNIARVARESGRGLVFQDEGALTEAFRTGQIYDCVHARRNASEFGSPVFGRMSMGLLGPELEHAT